MSAADLFCLRDYSACPAGVINACLAWSFHLWLLLLLLSQLFRLVAGAWQRGSLQGSYVLRWFLPTGAGPARCLPTGVCVCASLCLFSRFLLHGRGRSLAGEGACVQRRGFPMRRPMHRRLCAALPLWLVLGWLGLLCCASQLRWQVSCKEKLHRFGLARASYSVLLYCAACALAGIADRSAWGSFCEVQVSLSASLAFRQQL